MKKLLSTLVLGLMSLLFFPCMAQTSAPGLTVSTFCQPLSKSGQSASDLGISRALWGKLHCLKPTNVISSSLVKAGFKCDSKSTERVFDDSMDEYVSYLKAQYSKRTGAGVIYVNFDYDGISIKFPDAAEKNKFIANLKANGYNATQDSGYQIPGNSAAYWVGVSFRVDGNTIVIVGGQG